MIAIFYFIIFCWVFQKKAFKACAASYGCMNNLTFGNDTISYYETIGGGSGAGPSWYG